MEEGSLAKLIDDYRPKLAIAGKTPPYSDVDKLLKEFFNQVDLLVEIEDEIVTYLEESLSTGKWGKDYDLWLGTAINHPSPRYVNYLLRILAEHDSSYPHWKALDVLAYMRSEISAMAVPGLIRLMESNINPAWFEGDIIHKFFETLLWIGDDEGVSFIFKACDSSNETVAHIAKCFVEQYELDELESE